MNLSNFSLCQHNVSIYQAINFDEIVNLTAILTPEVCICSCLLDVTCTSNVCRLFHEVIMLYRTTVHINLDLGNSSSICVFLSNDRGYFWVNRRRRFSDATSSSTSTKLQLGLLECSLGSSPDERHRVSTTVRVAGVQRSGEMLSGTSTSSRV